MDSPFGDLDRPPLRAEALRRALAPDGWRVEVVARTGSTNADVAARARAGEQVGLVLVAELQSAGRGRLDRTWTSPPRAGLTLSVLLAGHARPGWVPLLAGLAVATALRDVAGVPAQLKWPNDVVVGGRKVAGLLAEVPAPGLVVVGLGLNVSTRREELPREDATSLVLEGAATTDRDTVLRAVLRALRAGGDPDGFRAACATLGRQVRVELPGGTAVTGLAQAVDDDGRLVVDGVPYAAGDVVHLR